jgi:ABC-type transport system involved in cytochrome c biogenesis permease subunit
VSLILLALYAGAAIAYGLHFARREASAGRTATTLLMIAVLVHTFVIAVQTMEAGQFPITNASRAVSAFVWLLALAYLYVEITTNERAMGVFILTVVVGLQLIPVLYPGAEAANNQVLDSPWFGVHVASLLFAYASFALAGVLGLIYVLQFKEIKKKQLGYFYTRLPSLQTLDAMNSRAVAIGWTLLTVGVVVGAVWAGQARAEFVDNRNVAAMSLADPKVFISVVTWVVYSFAMLARRMMGWTGRRAALLSASGFGIVLLNFIAVSYLLKTGSHTAF